MGISQTATQATSQETLRLRALATMEPLVRLRGTGSLDWVDHRDVAMFTLGCLLDSWNISDTEEMLTREALAHRIADRVGAQATAAGCSLEAASARDYGVRVVDILLNHDSQTGKFTAPIYDREAGTFESYSFYLLHYEEATDNRIYLVPSAEASNLYFQSFVVDVQDELLGQRHALEHHIRSGRTDRLAAAAEAHGRTASRLLAQTRSLARQAERSIRTVSPLGDIVPLMKEIHEAAKEAMGFDDSLRSKLSDHLSVATDASMPHVERAIIALNRARNFFLKTRNAAANMIVGLDRAVAAAGFRSRRRNVAMPDLDRDVAVPLMSAPLTDELTDEIICALLGARLPDLPALDVVILAEKCLPAPPRPLETDVEEEEFKVPASPLVARFGSKAHVAGQALDFVSRYGVAVGRLSGLLAHPETIQRGDAFGEALALVVNAAFKDQGGQEANLLRLPGMRLLADAQMLPDDAIVHGTDLRMEKIT